MGMEGKGGPWGPPFFLLGERNGGLGIDFAGDFV